MHPAWIEIDLAQFQRNLNAIRRRIGASLLCLTVKANAYGHGLVPMSLAGEKMGVDQLAVSCVDEGALLRRSGVRCPILVLGAVHEDQVGAILDYELECSISSQMKARFMAQACEVRKKSCIVHLEVDTGMRRTGMRPETALKVFDEMRSQACFQIKGIYSHFASADRAQHPFAIEQIRAFEALQRQFGKAGEGLLWHLAGSGGVAFYPQSHFNMVRPGLLCYGLMPDGSSDPEIRPCLSLKAKVSYFKGVAAGCGVSYDHLYTTKENTRIVTVPVGYGDGFPKSLSNKAPVLLRGARQRVAGSICMDQFMVDLGAKGVGYVGDEVTLIGRAGSEEVSLWELARLAGTDPRELLCHFSERIERRYFS